MGSAVWVSLPIEDYGGTNKVESVELLQSAGYEEILPRTRLEVHLRLRRNPPNYGKVTAIKIKKGVI